MAYSVSVLLMPAVGSSSRMTLAPAGDRHADLQRPLFGIGQQAGRHVAACGQIQVFEQMLGLPRSSALLRPSGARTSSGSHGSTAAHSAGSRTPSSDGRSR